MCTFLNELTIEHPIRIGIIGGGQLGKMISQEAKRMFLTVNILDPNKDCPASTLCDKLIVGDFKDEQKIYELSKYSDIITYEIELANSKALKNLESQNYPIYPSPHSLYIIQNKFRQKTFFKQNNLPVTEFSRTQSLKDLIDIACKFGFPFMLKASEESYDGRGNYLVKSKEDILVAFQHFKDKDTFAEKFVDFKNEISIMVARNQQGQIESFPIAENIHFNNILDTTIVPANISLKVQKDAKVIAENVMKCLNDVGIFGIEMFVSKTDEVFINEIAPRPHNSGHYSIEGCSISQFEQHIRAILNFPLGKPELLRPTIMKNILGPPNIKGNYKFIGLSKLLSIPFTKIHIYGKQQTSPGRKLGHITCTGETINQVTDRSIKAKNSLEIIQSTL
ncbi:MAG TPA: 5-(carboxyamino)imidazole ribonucleotide synthase [Nitrososphaeraceae archaeon]|nr:5-(carboxyamino)imidazole ribonucleotide synthase [Nitrososphaeraceae archaeon]